MTPQELELRTQRAVAEPLVISETGEGFRVYSPTGRSRPYMVTGTVNAPSCTCPDFQKHKEDPAWRCKRTRPIMKPCITSSRRLESTVTRDRNFLLW